MVESGAALGAGEGSPRTAFLFTGQGSQWVGMGRGLFDGEPAARDVLERCEDACRRVRGASLLDVMLGRAGAEADIDATEWAQPALYALGCALSAVWESVGIRPDVVMGHSVGEIAAARAAGVLGLEEGMRFALRRGEAMGALPAGGAMAAVFAPAERVRAALGEARRSGAGLDLAADNGAHQVVSGPEDRVAGIERRFSEEGVRTKRLVVSHAFHSRLMEPALADLEAAAGELGARGPSVPLVSNVTGQVVQAGESLDAAYWHRHARAPVDFAESVRTLAALGVNVVVELGPGATLGRMTALAWPAAGEAPRVVPGLEKGAGGARGFVEAVASAYAAGLPVAFEGLYAGESRRRVSAPAYPFLRKRYWVDERRDSRPGAEEARSLEGALLSRLREAPESRREGLLLDFVLQEVQGMLRLPSAPPADVGFFDLGMDSLMVAELRNRLNRALSGAGEISATEVFSHPDPARLARRLAARVEATPSAPARVEGFEPKPPVPTEAAGAEARPSVVPARVEEGGPESSGSGPNTRISQVKKISSSGASRGRAA